MMYGMIFKRKSFHLFRNIGSEKLTGADLQDIRDAYANMLPLHPEIRTAIRIVPADEKILGRGAEYAIEIYSETKDNYRINAGYLGQQIDHYCVSKNIGTLWFGIGRPESREYDGLTYVIMILIAKVDSDTKFRKDMFKSKRKPASETWSGKTLPGVTDIARFAPSACNSQPWKVEVTEHAPAQDNVLSLKVSRCRKPGKIGIMPIAMASSLNQIDIGIYLYILELCLTHENYTYTRKLFIDPCTDEELTPVAEYTITSAN